VIFINQVRLRIEAGKINLAREYHADCIYTADAIALSRYLADLYKSGKIKNRSGKLEPIVFILLGVSLLA
jgi:hypothetical protein